MKLAGIYKGIQQKVQNMASQIGGDKDETQVRYYHKNERQYNNDGSVEVKNFEKKNRRVAAALAIFAVGVFGGHKFYLGNTRAGYIQLGMLAVGFFLSAIFQSHFPIACVVILAEVEGIFYALSTDEEFHQTYVVEQRMFV